MGVLSTFFDGDLGSSFDAGNFKGVRSTFCDGDRGSNTLE